MDGRNIRASYGTSKYCSAFIKNVRCNNPDCTYLHCMGDAEDTFTKQEIQAGYVTSGRDVLARQQQIVAEQLSAAVGDLELVLVERLVEEDRLEQARPRRIQSFLLQFTMNL